MGGIICDHNRQWVTGFHRGPRNDGQFCSTRPNVGIERKITTSSYGKYQIVEIEVDQYSLEQEF